MPGAQEKLGSHLQGPTRWGIELGPESLACHLPRVSPNSSHPLPCLSPGLCGSRCLPATHLREKQPWPHLSSFLTHSEDRWGEDQNLHYSHSEPSTSPHPGTSIMESTPRERGETAQVGKGPEVMVHHRLWVMVSGRISQKRKLSGRSVSGLPEAIELQRQPQGSHPALAP
uniref:Uncharacterized protein n=1 Tax=Myotis myotis TaxID=51298 RepID=A0A7J7ZX90_MYOMY|nr:hypothetical protein mMyoMyo1_009617 [Myotis myotis]